MYEVLLKCFLLRVLLSGTWVGSLETGLRWKFNSRQTRKWTSRLKITFWWFGLLEMEYDRRISHKNKKCFIGLSGSSVWLNPFTQGQPTSPTPFFWRNAFTTHQLSLSIPQFFLPRLLKEQRLRNSGWALIKGYGEVHVLHSLFSMESFQGPNEDWLCI